MKNLFDESDDGLYSADVQIAATVYVKAGSADEARAKFQEWLDADGCVYAQCDKGAGDFNELYYDDDRLPEVSLSTAMTVKGLFPVTE